MKTSAKHFGEKLRHHALQSWQLGALLACYNLGILIAMLLLILVSLNTVLWVYVLLASPVFLTLFWFWFSQEVLRYYKHISIHDALMIAKVGSLPLVVFFLCAAVALGVVPNGENLPQWWITAVYYGTLFGFSAIMLEFTVVVFSLRHPFHLRTRRS
jgi:hypothetical protein